MLAVDDLQALLLTLKLSAVTTLFLLLVCTPLAWWLSQTRVRFKFVIDAIAALPLVLPPTVIGFYLLLLLGANGPLAQHFDVNLAFTFWGLVVGSMIYSFPFVLQPLQDVFRSLGSRPIETAQTLGAGPWDRFFNVALPLSKSGFLTATVLGFAHTLGEFGVVLMIGGNIPGETRLASIAIYEHVETLEYGQAHTLSLWILAIALMLLMFAYGFARRRMLHT
ncbi:MAG: molybdate ABC transporter permease subunit [Pseudomonadota bacterium]